MIPILVSDIINQSDAQKLVCGGVNEMWRSVWLFKAYLTITRPEAMSSL